MSISARLLKKVMGTFVSEAGEGVFRKAESFVTRPRVLPEPAFWPLYVFERARGLGFTAESLLMNGLGILMEAPIPHVSREVAVEVRQRYLSLLEEDARQIQTGVFPFSVLIPEAPQRHLKRFPIVLWEGLKISRRRARGETARFSAAATPHLERVPRYFRRNFHFQTDGYLTARSAELYDHQVEILFGGTADAMRRLSLKPLKEGLAKVSGKPKILEIACGAGSTTRFLAQTFPQASILATDLSTPYLRVAQERLKHQLHVQFLQAPGEALPLRDGEFDAVVSVFLFHELPEEVRVQVIQEAARVLKPGGVFVIVDSAQKSDLPQLHELWDLFPAAFHEPFYRNYQEVPLEGLLQKQGFGELQGGLGFLSKWVVARKSGTRIEEISLR